MLHSGLQCLLLVWEVMLLSLLGPPALWTGGWHRLQWLDRFLFWAFFSFASCSQLLWLCFPMSKSLWRSNHPPKKLLTTTPGFRTATYLKWSWPRYVARFALMDHKSGLGELHSDTLLCWEVVRCSEHGSSGFLFHYCDDRNTWVLKHNFVIRVLWVSEFMICSETLPQLSCVTLHKSSAMALFPIIKLHLVSETVAKNCFKMLEMLRN